MLDLPRSEAEHLARVPRDLAVVSVAAVLLAIASALAGCGESRPPDDAAVDAGSVRDAGAGDDAAIDDAGIARLRPRRQDVDDVVDRRLPAELGGSAAVAYPDGTSGIDNSFGKNSLPTILSLYPTFTSDTNASLDRGDFTTLLELMCLPPTGDVPVLATSLFDASPLGDVWSVDPSLLSDPTDPSSSTIVFPAGSVTGTTFDAGTGGTFVVSIPMRTATSSTFLRLTLRAARITMTLSSDRTSATSAMVGGVLATEELVSEVRKIGALSGSAARRSSMRS